MHTLHMVHEMIQVLELQRLSTVLGIASRDLLHAVQFLPMLSVKMIIHDSQPVVPKRLLLV